MASVVLMGDPSVANIPVDECGEPLEAAGSDFAMSPLKEADDPYRSRLRAGVRNRLVAAQSHLPTGFRICWVEGHRDARLQEHYFTNYRQHLQGLDPTLDGEASHLLASRYVSPPAVAPHVSGAAIDLTLVDGEGTPVDMGTPINATPEDSAGACYFGAVNISSAARHHRRVLATALDEAGLVNYPTEWWHWSYGDRYWAFVTDQPAAIYGPIRSFGTAAAPSTR